MNKRLPINKNLHIHTDSTFRGLRYIDYRGPVAYEYLEIIHNVMTKAIAEHKRTRAIRFDLRYPQGIVFSKPQSVIEAFIKKLRAYIQADLAERRRRGVRVHPTSLRYIWCRESTPLSEEHYHVIIFVNNDTYYHLGDFNSTERGLVWMIRKAWLRTLKLPLDANASSVEFPNNFGYSINGYDEEFEKVFFRISYFAKIDTKHYGLGYRSFGSSNI